MDNKKENMRPTHIRYSLLEAKVEVMTFEWGKSANSALALLHFKFSP